MYIALSILLIGLLLMSGLAMRCAQRVILEKIKKNKHQNQPTVIPGILSGAPVQVRNKSGLTQAGIQQLEMVNHLLAKIQLNNQKTVSWTYGGKRKRYTESQLLKFKEQLV